MLILKRLSLPYNLAKVPTWYLHVYSTYLILAALTLLHLHRPHIAAANSLASSALVERCRPASVISSQRGGGIIVIDTSSYGTGKVR